MPSRLAKHLTKDIRCGLLQQALQHADVMHLSAYCQPLRGKPIEDLPAAELAAYGAGAPAADAPAREAAQDAAQIPRTPAQHSQSRGVPLKKPLLRAVLSERYTVSAGLLMPTMDYFLSVATSPGVRRHARQPLTQVCQSAQMTTQSR